MRFRSMIACGVAISAFGSVAAHAQTTTAVSKATGTQTEEIVVTARKTSERLSRTPLAVSAATGETLKRKGIVTVDDIGAFVPNVVIDHAVNGVNIAMRGVQSNDEGGLTQEAGVAVIQDGVQNQDQNALIFPFFDVDHVEVLRGPQGTLYGPSSPGGVINIISNKPGWTFGGTADMEIGNYNAKRGNFAVNVPINDVLATRLAVSANDRDGYILQEENSPLGSAASQPGGNVALNAEHDVSARGSVLYRPDAETSALLQATGSHSYDSSYSSVPYSTVFANQGGGPAERSVPNNAIEPATDDNYYSLNGDLNKTFDGIAAEYVGGFLKVKLDDINPDGGGIIPPGGPGWLWLVNRTDDETQSHELRFHNAVPATFDWTVGATYLGLRAVSSGLQMGAPCLNPDQAECHPGGSAPNIGGPTNPTVADSFAGNINESTTVRRNVGIFATGQYRLSDELRLTAGVRNSWDSIAQNGDSWNSGPTPPSQNPCNYYNAFTSQSCLAGQGTYLSESVQQSKFTWKLGADYTPSATALYYVNISTGYKPGGFNQPSPFAEVPKSFAPENLVSYEVGYKGTVIPNVTIDSDLYYYDYSSEQVGNVLQIGGQSSHNFVGITSTTPVTTYGTENTAVWAITPNDSITASANYLRAYFTDLLAGGGGGHPLTSWAGKEVNNAPTFTGSIGYRHRFDFGDRGDVVFNANTSFTEEYFVNVIANLQIYKQPPFTNSGMDLTYTTADGRYYVQGFVKNIEDKVQITFFQGNPFQSGNGNVGITEPRFFGVRMGTKF